MADSSSSPALSLPFAAGIFDDMTRSGSFSRSLHQNGRLMQLHIPALPALALIALQADIHEAVSQPFAITLEAISTNAHIELKTLLGEEAVLQLLQPNRSYRQWHTRIAAAQYLGSDGGLTHYRLHLRSCLEALAHSSHNRVFQGLDALQIVQAVLASHPWVQWRSEVRRSLPVRSTCAQYQESDLAFVQRLLAQEGLHYVFEHPPCVADAAALEGQQHTLLIRDAHGSLPDLGVVRFSSAHPSAHLLTDGQAHADSITAFMAQRTLTPNATALASWDYKQLAAPAAELDSALRLGNLPRLQIFDGSGAYRFEDAQEALAWSERALQALELDIKRFEGAGQTRHFCAGSTFGLIDHPLYGANTTAADYAGASMAAHQRPDNAFTLLAVRLQVRNNLGGQLAGSWLQRILQLEDAQQAAAAGEHGQCLVRFNCCPAAAAIMPRHWQRPHVHGMQTATVVGLPESAARADSQESSPLHTERDLRIRIRFAWQQDDAEKTQPNNPQQAQEQTQTQTQAQTQATASTWVRVAQPAAGANWGWVLPFRVGGEVAVEFIEGDIDRPVVVGALYNGQDAPAFAAGQRSGANHPGVISGWHVPDVDGAGFAQWVMDDATGQLRMRMLASYSAAEVGLGHLIAQPAAASNAPAVRGAWRGLGFEAATHGWSTWRAPKGMLLSTAARKGDSAGSVQGCQMDAQEALQQLHAAQTLAHTLNEAARASACLGIHASSPGGLCAHAADLDAQQRGRHPAQVNGQVAKTQDSCRQAADAVPSFAHAHVLLDSASRMAWTTQGSLMQYAAGSMLHLAQGDVQLSAAATCSSASGAQTALFAAGGDVKVVAAQAPVWLRAHADALQMQAKGDMALSSTEECIEVQASEQIELIGGNCRITLKGADITFACPNTFTIKSSQHVFLPPGDEAAAMQALPAATQSVKDWIEIKRLYADGTPVHRAKYTVKLADGSIHKGRLNNQGFARIENVPLGKADIKIDEDARQWIINEDYKDLNIDNPAYGKTLTAKQAMALYNIVFGDTHRE